MSERAQCGNAALATDLSDPRARQSLVPLSVQPGVVRAERHPSSSGFQSLDPAPPTALFQRSGSSGSSLLKHDPTVLCRDHPPRAATENPLSGNLHWVSNWEHFVASIPQPLHDVQVPGVRPLPHPTSRTPVNLGATQLHYRQGGSVARLRCRGEGTPTRWSGTWRCSRRAPALTMPTSVRAAMPVRNHAPANPATMPSTATAQPQAERANRPSRRIVGG